MIDKELLDALTNEYDEIDEEETFEDIPLDEYMRDVENAKQYVVNGKHLSVDMKKGTKKVKVLNISNLYIGYVPEGEEKKNSKPLNLNTLKKHIEIVKNDPEAVVVLGGDLFYVPAGGKKARQNVKYTMNQQLGILVQLLSPIKDKVVAVIDGDMESRYHKLESVNPTKALADKLGILDRYCSYVAELDFIMNNSFTGGKDYPIHALFTHGFLTATSMVTVGEKTKDMKNLASDKDVYVCSHYNQLMEIPKASMQKGKGESNEVVAEHYITVPGYKDVLNDRYLGRNSNQIAVENRYITLSAWPNSPEQIKGANFLTQPKMIVDARSEGINRGDMEEFNFPIMEEITKRQLTNMFLADTIISHITRKLQEQNKNIVRQVLTKTYGKPKAINPIKSEKNGAEIIPFTSVCDTIKDKEIGRGGKD